MDILIVGAGPVGLAAAVELTRQGQPVRIVDENSSRTHLSKAIAVNPHTLEILAPSGMSALMIAAGLKVTHANMRDGEHVLHLNFAVNTTPFNFVLSLPQSETERILETELNRLGVSVERETKCVGLEQNDAKVSVEIQTATGTSKVQFDYVIGSDGAHSTIRKELGVSFMGKAYEDDWSLADAEIDWPYGYTEFNLLINNGLVMAAIPIQEGRLRLVATCKDVLEHLPAGAQVHQVIWQSQFHVSCRQVDHYQKGRVFLAGDAAHIHSPAGGRGMNLGIEDAVVLANKILHGGLDTYSQERHAVGAQVLRDTDRMFRMAATKNPLLRGLRNYVLFPLLNLPWIQKPMAQQFLGLR